MSNYAFFKCNKCGKVFIRMSEKGCTPYCCGEETAELVPGAVDAAVEKHVPAVTRTDAGIEVVVGSVEHPMTEEHLIEWIALEDGDRLEIRKLAAGEAPKATFAGDIADGATVYAYCNLHGLWKAEV